MTDIRKLMEEATPLPINHADLHEWLEERPANAPLAAMSLNALPAVLEYMKHEHHQYCAVVQQELWSKTWRLQQTVKRECTCGYDALTRALGLQEGEK